MAEEGDRSRDLEVELVQAEKTVEELRSEVSSVKQDLQVYMHVHVQYVPEAHKKDLYVEPGKF